MKATAMLSRLDREDGASAQAIVATIAGGQRAGQHPALAKLPSDQHDQRDMQPKYRDKELANDMA
jgi:hypothetical protein